jgi:DNA processing protein
VSAPDRWELRLGEPDYPDCLADTPWPPKILYGVGDVSVLATGLGVVGARKATPYGLSAARRFAGWAAGCGHLVVSGAAIGCDLAAQRAALDAGGVSVAVLGCGADVDYPHGAADLLAELRTGSGAVLSELPWGTPPLKWAFRQRNRIIAALSAALLVVEARVPSGTFSTADFALDAGRDVLAVPGSILAPECRGPNRLIRQGATCITDVSELADALACAGLVPGPREATEPSESGTLATDDPLLAALAANPARPDDLVVSLDLDVLEVLRRLSRLEADGVVVRYRDGRFGARSPEGCDP